MSQRNARELSDQIDEMLAHLTPADARRGSDDRPHPATASAAPSEWRTYLHQQSASLAQLQDTELRTLDALKASVASIVLSSAVDAHNQSNNALATAAAADRSDEPMTPPRPHDSSAVLALRPSDPTQQQQQHWLRDADPATLQLHEQDALLYNRYSSAHTINRTCCARVCVSVGVGTD